MRFGTFIPIILYITKPLFLSPNSYKLALSSPIVSKKAVFCTPFAIMCKNIPIFAPVFKGSPP